MIDSLYRPVFTDKTTRLIEEYDQWTFDIALNVTKLDLKKLLEEYYNVQISKITTKRLPRKSRRFSSSTRAKFAKRAIVQLVPGQIFSFSPE
jgi:large subunit ribosomal protein L23